MALPTLLEAVEELRAHPAAIKVSEAGSARRRRETVRDVDIIATARDHRALIAHFTGLPWVAEVAAAAARKPLSSQGTASVSTSASFPPSAMATSSSTSPARRTTTSPCGRRRNAGASISEYGVVVMDTGETITHRDEKELYEFLGYQFIPPELRESAGELEAARGGSLPKLVELRHLKGDLHSHTTWSSARHNTVEEMAVAAMERGYEYLAVTDHSHYLREGRMEEAGPGDRRGEREGCAVQAARAIRGQHSRRRLARRAG